MEGHLPIIFFIFSIISLGSCAGETASLEVYWKKMLPNTPMPKAITDSLHPEGMDHKGTLVTVGKGPKVYMARPASNKNYASAATETQLHDDSTVALFCLQKDLQPGTKKILHFPRKYQESAFLSRHEADSIPFSTAEFPAILGRFAVEPKSEEASIMKQTIQDCEQTDVVAGEEKYCPTSLESMVDFAVSRLGAGRSVAAVSTDAKLDDGKRKEFVVRGVKEVSKGGEFVACHKGMYPYAVFYCHTTKRTAAYTVELKAEGEGEVVEAVAVCHMDTSAWNPKHLAFQVLKVKPGSVPVCHFLLEDQLIWVRY